MLETSMLERTPRRYELMGALPFVVAHLAVLGVFWSGVTMAAVWCGIGLYWLRMFAVTAGYHRYFAHRTFKTSRVAQFVLAFLAQTSAQKGVLWWASHHRRHHALTDRPGDLHSPRQDGLFYAHVGWIFNHTSETNWNGIRDFARFPELRLLNRFPLAPAILLAAAVTFWLGWPGLFVGFFASTVVLWHASFTINSLAHRIGRRRFQTHDNSRNNVWLALLTMGEGWHNNHHRFVGTARQGFYWYEVDATYYLLRGLAWLGIVWELRPVPQRILDEGRHHEVATARPPQSAVALAADGGGRR
ncbi:MAG: acyl-CoA desaturase [Deltaproteobacteria bacterium]|nr:acyl-CoA desaturase [Deltaproteobacteria bacterium]